MKTNVAQINAYHEGRNMLLAMEQLEAMFAEPAPAKPAPSRGVLVVHPGKFIRACIVAGVLVWFIRSIV